MPEKIRLDIYMTENKMTESREKARMLIKNGQVSVNGQILKKAGSLIYTDNSKVEIIGNVLRYVSRGGLKLEKAINVFNIDLNNKVAVDIGASTGGFTDCMLKNGAKKVFAVDVGYGQLDKKLTEDKRVINMEKTNIRYVTPADIGGLADFISIDVSFISLKYVLPIAGNLLNDTGEIIALIKPQFEAGKGKINKKGVVKNVNVHLDVCNDIIKYIKESGLYPVCLDFSPIKGPEGNIEYLVYIKKTKSDKILSDNLIKQTVLLSHEYFKENNNL